MSTTERQDAALLGAPGTQPPGSAQNRSAAIKDMTLGTALLLFGLWFLWQASGISQGPGHSMIGTRFFPYVVGGGLCLCGLGVLVNGLRARRSGAAGPDLPAVDWRGFLSVAGLLLAYIVAYLPLGFVLASTLMIVAGARAFDSVKPVRDLICALALSTAAFLLFTQVIKVELPVGWLIEAFL